MMIAVVTRKVKSFLLLLLGLVKRCFCCLRKRRYSDVGLPISVETSEGILPKSLNDNKISEDDAGWDLWDGPSSVVSDGGGHSRGDNPPADPIQQHIQQYRINQKKKLTEVPMEIEPEPNYFEDLAPKFSNKPKVVILERAEEEQLISNRLSASLSDSMLQSSDLLDWNEDERGWEEEAEEEADLSVALKEQRQRERMIRRQQQLRKKAEKDASKSLQQSKLATKLS